MEWYVLGPLIMVGFLLALALGMPIAFAFGIVATLGFFLLIGENALNRIPQIAHESVNSFILTALPVYIFIAEAVEFTGISKDLYTAIERWLGKLRGGLAISSVVACAGFGAVSGSSAATAATIGRIAIPEMMARGYDKRLASGTLSTGGTLGLMIPPSLAFIIYGVMSETSIGKLFIAGIVPGIMLAIMLSLYIFVHTSLRPHLAPQSAGATWRERFSSLWRVWAVVLLALVILGSIYLGIATPTEAGAMGAVMVLILAALYRRLNMVNLSQALLRAAQTSGFILFIIIGAMTFANLLALEEIPRELALLITGWQVSPWLIIASMGAVYFLLGMFMEGAAILVLTVPIFTPLITALGFDLIWFGVLVVLFIELALITPPIGLNCFVIAGIAKPYGVDLVDVFRGVLPFVVVVVVAVAILVAFPQLALWLPETMR